MLSVILIILVLSLCCGILVVLAERIYRINSVLNLLKLGRHWQQIPDDTGIEVDIETLNINNNGQLVTTDRKKQGRESTHKIAKDFLNGGIYIEDGQDKIYMKAKGNDIVISFPNRRQDDVSGYKRKEVIIKMSAS